MSPIGIGIGVSPVLKDTIFTAGSALTGDLLLESDGSVLLLEVAAGNLELEG